MGKLNGKDATVWMRALRPHTYEGKPKDDGDIYLAHEEMVDTIEILRFAVREPAPARAIRTDKPPVVETAESSIPTQPAPVAGEPVETFDRPPVNIGVSTSTALPKPRRSRK